LVVCLFVTAICKKTFVRNYFDNPMAMRSKASVGWWNCGLEWGGYYVSVLRVLCCQVQVCETDRSHIQRSPIVCVCVSVDHCAAFMLLCVGEWKYHAAVTALNISNHSPHKLSSHPTGSECSTDSLHGAMPHITAVTVETARCHTTHHSTHRSHFTETQIK
jgi:hypothetical protein